MPRKISRIGLFCSFREFCERHPSLLYGCGEGHLLTLFSRYYKKFLRDNPDYYDGFYTPSIDRYIEERILEDEYAEVN